MPGFPRIDRLPEPFCCSRVHSVTVAWILLQHASAPGRKRNALNLVEELSGTFALINTGAGAGVNDVWLFGIDDDGENVGVIDDAVLDIVPALAAIAGLPRQMPGTGINHIGVGGINLDRLNIPDHLATLRSGDLTGLSCVTRSVHTIQISCY